MLQYSEDVDSSAQYLNSFCCHYCCVTNFDKVFLLYPIVSLHRLYDYVAKDFTGDSI